MQYRHKTIIKLATYLFNVSPIKYDNIICSTIFKLVILKLYKLIPKVRIIKQGFVYEFIDKIFIGTNTRNIQKWNFK